MVKQVKAPNEYFHDRFSKTAYVFLAGSIEMGKAENWQDKVFKELEKENKDILVLNPRRDDWDSSWVQSIENEQFRKQVEWELKSMDNATLIAMYFDPTTKSPITLLELGLHAKDNKVIVCCPKGYWRRGNIEVVCAKYKIPLVNNIEDFLKLIREKI